MKTRAKKIIISTICFIVAVAILVPLCYVLYVVFSYNRIEDDLTLEIVGESDGIVPIGKSLKLTTYNIGFGAYSADYSFFMDGGEYSRAFSKDAVIKNTSGALDAIQKESPDFALFQEVDTDGTRSHHVDQSKILASGFDSYEHTFAQNYNSSYLFYPFDQPIGANRSGIMTFSSFNITSSVRQSLPVENSIYKFFDLDRAYSVSVTKTDNGKELVIYNVHLSAYTSDGTIADEQLKMLCADMQEQYLKGNYVIAAGDFNKDMLGDSSKYFERPDNEEFTWAKPLNTSFIPDTFNVYSGSNLPTCRNADSPYAADGTDFVLSVDGFIVSDNISVSLCETMPLNFAYSDHNPVKLEFVLSE